MELVHEYVLDRGNVPPSLHDLRDSGAIEQDADVVAFIHRPILVNPDLGDDWRNYALLRTAKNRQGRTGDVHLFCQGEQTCFSQWTVADQGFRQDSRKGYDMKNLYVLGWSKVPTIFTFSPWKLRLLLRKSAFWKTVRATGQY